jgi:hypothetical protein
LSTAERSTLHAELSTIRGKVAFQQPQSPQQVQAQVQQGGMMGQPAQAPLQLPPYFQGHPAAGGPFFPYGNVAALGGYYVGSYPNQNCHPHHYPHFAPSPCVPPMSPMTYGYAPNYGYGMPQPHHHHPQQPQSHLTPSQIG